MKTSFDIPYKKSGDRLITAEEQNALTYAARKDYYLKRGTSNRNNQAAWKENTSTIRWEYVTAHADIPSFSVFTITYGRPFSSMVPTAFTQQAATNPVNIIATSEEWAYKGDQKYLTALIGFEEPKLVNYDPTEGTPVVGDTLGPKPGTYKAAKGLVGLVAVSDADTDNEQVWVIRHVGVDVDPSIIPMFEFTQILEPGYTATARRLYWDTPSETYMISGADTKEYVLFDPEEQNMFLLGERVHATLKTLPANQGGVFADAEILGEHGLHRKVRVYGDVECGEVGDTIIWTVGAAFKQHPPVRYPTDPDCVLTSAGAGASLKVCNNYGFRRNTSNASCSTSTIWCS
ncbi:unnamed protein product, partial [marine sediment metagenome]